MGVGLDLLVFVVRVEVVWGGHVWVDVSGDIFPEREFRTHLKFRLLATALLVACLGRCVGAVTALGPHLDAHDLVTNAFGISNFGLGTGFTDFDGVLGRAGL
jgi:hypothetical protein